MLVLYNSLGRRHMVFRARRRRTVTMYTCGPTVWNYAHLGNMRTFVFYDLLRRYLKFKGYKVIHVMNITDVEDKIIKAVRETGKSLKEITGFYERELMQDLEKLRVERFEYYPRATEHINDMLKIIKDLLEKGYAYKAEDGSVYFNVSKFKEYGKLSGVKRTELIRGERVLQDHYEKRDAVDFALWKAWDKEDGDVFWDTEIGKGRPGWHIECSAMSIKYLGVPIDIHAGGKDLKFPHHENEIAQSEAYTGKKFVRYWLHTEFLNISGEEMHKSKGNYVTLRDMLAEGWNPLTIRYFLISSHYRDPLNLTKEALAHAENSRKRIQEFVFRVASSVREVREKEAVSLALEMVKDFESAMDSDLNVPLAMSYLFRFIRRINEILDKRGLSRKESRYVLNAIKKVDSVLRIIEYWPEELGEEIMKKIRTREEARKKGNYELADKIRDELRSHGIILEDTRYGTIWKKSTK